MVTLARFVAALLLAFAVPACAAAIDEPAFTREMAARVAAAAKVKLEVAGPLTLAATNGATPGRINLDRVFAFCAANPAADCEEAKARFAAGIAETLTTTYEVTADRLRLAVRSADYCRELAAGFADRPDNAPLLRPLAPGLCALMMADYPTTTRLVAAADLPALHLDRDAAWALARRQVLAALPRLSTQRFAASSLTAIEGFEYIPSLMLDDAEWTRLKARLGDDMVVALPADNLLLIGVAADGPAIGGLRTATAQSFAAAERAVSPLVYRWTGSAWEPAR